jgi:hypothetical protein
MIDHRSLKSCAKAGLTCNAIKAMTIAIEVARMTASPTNNQNQPDNAELRGRVPASLKPVVCALMNRWELTLLPSRSLLTAGILVRCVILHLLKFSLSNLLSEREHVRHQLLQGWKSRIRKTVKILLLQPHEQLTPNHQRRCQLGEGYALSSKREQMIEVPQRSLDDTHTGRHAAFWFPELLATTRQLAFVPFRRGPEAGA